MANIQVNYYFRDGRTMKGGKSNPGILVIDECYEFLSNKISVDEQCWKYLCKYRMTPGVNCKARATVLKILNEENRVFQYILANHDVSHQCEPNKPKMIAEKMKHDMKLRVRSNPSDPVMATILEVREEAANIYGNDEELFNKITYELGANRPIVKQLLRVRHDVIGKTPQNRNDFNVNEFINNVLGKVMELK